MSKSSRWLLAASAGLLAPVFATAAVNPSDIPLASGTTLSVKPNIMFILDDSGSMGRYTMPDGVSDNTIGMRSNACNTIYYNPATAYVIPKGADGTNLNNASQTSFTSAYKNGYDSYMGSSSGSTNLSSSFSADDNESGRAAYYWVLNDPTTNTSGTILTPDTGICNHSTGSVTSTTVSICCDTRADKNYNTSCSNPTYKAAGVACEGTKTLVWKKILVSTTSSPTGGDERQNFANWHSYYRSRMMMMKAAGSRAFQNLSNKYRIGFITINPGSPVSDTKFLPIKDFDTAHKSDWYTKFYAQTAGNYTPLRQALSRVGRYFGGKSDGDNQGMIDTAAGKPDPVQYSCQQNFAILTTDGYWNSTTGRLLSGSAMSAVSYDSDYAALDAYNTVGAKWFISPYPMFDGASQTRTIIDKENEYQATSSGCSPVSAGTALQQRTAQLQRQISQLTKSTSTLLKLTGQLQKSTKSGGSWSAYTNTASCTWGGSTRCRYVWDSGVTATGTCSIAYSTGTSGTWSGNGTDCSYTAWSSPVGAASCLDTPRSTGPISFDRLTAYQCATAVTSPWQPVTSCQVISTPDATGKTTQCSYGSWSGWTTNPSCAASASTGPDYTIPIATDCATNPITMATQKLQYRTYTKTTTAVFKGDVQQSTTTTWSPVSPTVPPWNDVSGTACTRVDQPTVPYSPLPSRRRPLTSEVPLPTAPCTAWPCTTVAAPTGGSTRSLADVAQYYYVTDLRPTGTTGAGGADVSENNVPAAGTGVEDDKATWQHMTTFTLGLGLAGTLNYSPNYKTGGSADFEAIRQGTKSWPKPTDSENVPNDEPEKLDDLWHAAVNGRGQFFSATNPDTVVESLTKALAGINNRVASAAAAATSTLEPVAGDNFAYIAKYVTGAWSGDLEAKTIALVDDAATGTSAGEVSAEPVWSAAAKLAAQVGTSCDTRKIKLFRSGATDNLVDFKWGTYSCDASGVPTGSAVTTLDATEKAHFSAANIALTGQYPFMSDGSGGTVNQRTDSAGAPLVNFLRGQHANEGFAPNTTGYFRARTGPLGDIVNAQPLYVRQPLRNYIDTGYSAFKAAHATRAPVVYLAANDGMLHAFNGAADGGNELWAFMPTFSLPNLFRLADTDYPNNHRFYTDGSPISGDVYDSSASAWKTIVVGGMNKGGKGYYALDVTDPNNPKGLWEFTHADLGYTYGNPLIGKLADNTWAVMVTSGIDNADGRGYLFILDAITGALRYKIATSVGDAANPSGLTKLTAWIVADANTNMLFNHVYGVDILGNVWRFDINDTMGPAGREATLLATLKDSAGTPQPITTKPIGALVGNDIMLFVGTGSYLSLTDLANSQVQTVYGFKDNLTTPASGALIPDVRATLAHQQMMTVGTGLAAVRGFATCQPAPNGWYVDLPDSKERVNVDMRRALGSLIVASNVPIPSACRVGGYSWLSNFSLTGGCSAGATAVAPPEGSPSAGKLGSYVQAVIGGEIKYIKVTSGKAGTSGESLVVGVSIIMVDGKYLAVVQFSDGHTETIDPDVEETPPAGRRVTWREIVLP
jgi:type IV pilus assembly protein PilY1